MSAAEPQSVVWPGRQLEQRIGRPGGLLWPLTPSHVVSIVRPV